LEGLSKVQKGSMGRKKKGRSKERKKIERGSECLLRCRSAKYKTEGEVGFGEGHVKNLIRSGGGFAKTAEEKGIGRKKRRKKMAKGADRILRVWAATEKKKRDA